MQARVVASTSLTRSSMSGPPRDNPGRTAVRTAGRPRCDRRRVRGHHPRSRGHHRRAEPPSHTRHDGQSPGHRRRRSSIITTFLGSAVARPVEPEDTIGTPGDGTPYVQVLSGSMVARPRRRLTTSVRTLSQLSAIAARSCAQVGSRSPRHRYAHWRGGNVVRIVRRSQPGVSGVWRRAGRPRLRGVVRQPRRAVLDPARISGLHGAAFHVLSRAPVRQGRSRAVGPGPASSHAG